jgi:ABC-type lipoprotein export system ATPase subunit
LKNSYDSLSGGEKQRIGLIICKLLKRKIILLDEPSSALDKDTALKAIDFVFYLAETTIISISHDERWLARSDRVLTMKNE